MNEIDLILKSIIGVGVGFIVYVLKANSIKLNKMAIDLAVIKSIIDDVKDDHENILKLSFRIDKHEFDINNAYEKIRLFNK